MTAARVSGRTIDLYSAAPEAGPIRFLLRLNPLAKIAAPLPAMIVLLFTRDIASPLAFSVLAVLMVVVGVPLNGRALAALLLGVPAVVAVMSLSFGLWTDARLVSDTPVLFQLGDYRILLGSLAVGLATSLRLASVLLLALISGLSTTGPDLVRSLIQHLRVPYRLGYTALAAYRFVPRFGHELDVIRQAHRVRGMAGGRGPVAWTRRHLGYVVPLLAGAIRHAERVALAMDSRAFGAHDTRTERYLIPFRARDWVFIALFWTTTAGVFAAVALVS